MIKAVRSETKYKGKAFSVRQDQLQLPNGRISKLDIVDHVGAVTIFPIDEDGNVWFVEQYRHATGGELLELPAGTLEDGEEPAACAQREIQEEIGMAAGSMQKIGEFFMLPGYSTEYMHIYLATSLTPSELPGDDDEFLRVERVHITRVLEMAWENKFRDGKTLAALMLALPYLDIPTDGVE
ncbi:MAG: NUDIX hydrolase [Anaerolineales bacterium]|nr:NUDIX hydrolase [Chloroflexota bacterium]MBL6981607.1 NUDIX hydrolase [Anaerolineales bacterium]